MGNRISEARVEALRSLPLTAVLDGLGLYWKADPDYRPTKDRSSRRINVSADAAVYELLLTGQRWYDMRSKKGGGGALDLAMYLTKMKFRDAVTMLSGLQRELEQKKQVGE